jgi:hypothetical protein
MFMEATHMRNAKTYHIIEIDANDKEMVLSSGLSRKDANEKLGRLRDEYGKHGLRFVMYHDKVQETLAQHDRRINREYKASLRKVQSLIGNSCREEARSRGLSAL